MRVWDIHPGYLSNRSLLGEHSEIHALYSIISENKGGFSRHPETQRWTGYLRLLVLRHNLIIKEMSLRDFNHNSPLQLPRQIEENDQINQVPYIDLPSAQFEILRKRYLTKGQQGRIPLPKKGTEFWSHHKYSVMARGYQYYKDIQSFMKNRQNFPIVQENDLIVKIHSYIKIEIPVTALDNVALHLWGYFKEKASAEEKGYFFTFSSPIAKLNFLFSMAKKFQVSYLLQSTIFADFLPD